MAALLGILAVLGRASPWVLLALTFALGVGGAISLPAWQATVQDIVPRRWVTSAVALNSISFNVARAIGPALGGLVVAAFGAAFAFFSNAVSFLAVLAAVALWKREPVQASRLSEDVVGAIRSGFRYLLHAPRLQAPIIRAIAFNLCAAAVWPLLPLYARDVLDLRDRIRASARRLRPGIDPFGDGAAAPAKSLCPRSHSGDGRDPWRYGVFWTEH